MDDRRRNLLSNQIIIEVFINEVEWALKIMKSRWSRWKWHSESGIAEIYRQKWEISATIEKICLGRKIAVGWNKHFVKSFCYRVDGLPLLGLSIRSIIFPVNFPNFIHEWLFLSSMCHIYRLSICTSFFDTSQLLDYTRYTYTSITSISSSCIFRWMTYFILTKLVCLSHFDTFCF